MFSILKIDHALKILLSSVQNASRIDADETIIVYLEKALPDTNVSCSVNYEDRICTRERPA